MLSRKFSMVTERHGQNPLQEQCDDESGRSEFSWNSFELETIE